MRSSEDLTDFHDTEAAKRLWCNVIESAVLASRRGDFSARQWFKSDVWIQVSRLMFDQHTREAIERRALAGRKDGSEST